MSTENEKKLREVIKNFEKQDIKYDINYIRLQIEEWFEDQEIQAYTPVKEIPS